MPYELQTDERVQDGLRRSAREQLDRAIDDLSAGVKQDPVTAVHDARKALKKERSLLRLSRGTIDRSQRRRENIAVRDAGRRLSAARDAEVMLQAVDDLSDRFAGQAPSTTFDAVRRHLEAERDPARQQLLESGLTGQVAEELKSVRARIDQWRLRQGGWKAIEPGLLRSYRRGRASFEQARERPSVENLHDWRKRAKDLWYHLRMLQPIAPAILGGQVDEAHHLADLLGDDHDLAVLSDTLRSGAGELAIDVDQLLGLIDHRRAQLQAEALLVGARLYAESPKLFARRIRCYWKAQRAEARVAQAHRPGALA